MLGLGDLGRLRGDPGDAHAKYLEALDILREIDARPEIARCLAGLGRVAIELDELGLARQHLAESLRLCRSTGSRIGMARGLEAFAALAADEKRPEQAVRLAAAATALRERAGLPALSGARALSSLVIGPCSTALPVPIHPIRAAAPTPQNTMRVMPAIQTSGCRDFLACVSMSAPLFYW